MRILIFALAFLSFVAHSAIPEKGMWWNPAENGRGYGIDVQDDLIFITYYGYRDNGTSTFFTSLGIVDSGTSEVEADWVSFRGGQCWGCEYSAPTPSIVGKARFKFDTPVTGSIRLNSGAIIPIQRQSAIDFNSAGALLGTWQMTYGALGIYYGDVLWVNKIQNAAEGKVSGVRVGGGAQRILAGGVSATEENIASILVDSSTSYYTFYYFSRGFDKLSGRSWTFLKTSSPTGDGLPLFGSQLLGGNMSNRAFGSSSATNLSEIEFSFDKGISDGANIRIDDDKFERLSRLNGNGDTFFINDVQYQTKDMVKIVDDLKHQLSKAAEGY